MGIVDKTSVPGIVRAIDPLTDPDYTVSGATFDVHEGDTIPEHQFVNVLSPSSSL